MPGETVMRIGIDMKGLVTEIKLVESKGRVGKPEPINPNKSIKVKASDDVASHTVIAYETNPERCVTYYYPGGAYTV